MAKKHEDEVEYEQLRIQKINNIMSKADEKSVRKFVVIEGTKRSVYLRESPKMVEEPRIEIVR